MKVFNAVGPLQRHLNRAKCEGKKIGLVPTMGALHSGHLSLVRHAKMENDVTVTTIYVNPTQFNNKSDLKNYPRELDDDLQRLENEQCDLVFVPSDELMYPSATLTSFSFGYLENSMEGKYRPGHFNGVATVVSKLFNIVQPHRAYFGQKDLQQFHIIKNLRDDLSFQIDLRCIPIVREADGLAMSSRNKRLNEEDRKKSVILHQALVKAKEMLLQGVSLGNCKSEVKTMFEEHEVKLEYFEIVSAENLKPLVNISGQIDVAICVAAYLKDIRLIDNLIFTLNAK
ncbi:MAG: pantoate--beta-alanine ligase [Fulvivirga sp.]|nr:pantoate--beta-alanine ligase [Fulvivirga sp.]